MTFILINDDKQNKTKQKLKSEKLLHLSNIIIVYDFA